MTLGSLIHSYHSHAFVYWYRVGKGKSYPQPHNCAAPHLFTIMKRRERLETAKKLLSFFMETMGKQTLIIASVIGLVVGLGLGYWYGSSSGYSRGDSAGYKRAEEDIKKIQTAAGEKAAKDAATAANPFQGVNPLAGVESNPFEKAKKVLNPFQ